MFAENPHDRLTVRWKDVDFDIIQMKPEYTLTENAS